MSDSEFDAIIRETQQKVKESQAKIQGLTGRIESARSKIDAGEADIDIENATLEDVHAHTDVMNANIAELIMGLDDVTSAFSKDFDEMRSKTGWESFVGIFAGAKSDSMRQETNPLREHRRQAAGSDRQVGCDRSAARRAVGGARGTARKG